MVALERLGRGGGGVVRSEQWKEAWDSPDVRKCQSATRRSDDQSWSSCHVLLAHCVRAAWG